MNRIPWPKSAWGWGAGIAAAALLGMFVWGLAYYRWILPERVKRLHAAERLTPILGLVPDDIIELEVRGAGRLIKLCRLETGWELQEPLAAPTQADAVEELLDALCSWTPQRRLTPTEAKTMHAGRNAYSGLENGIVISATTSKAQTAVFTLGSVLTQSSLRYARRLDAEEIVLLPPLALPDISSWVDWLRNRRLLSLTAGRIQTLTFRERETVISLERVRGEKSSHALLDRVRGTWSEFSADPSSAPEGSWRITFPIQTPADEKLVNELLGLLVTWDYIEVVEEVVRGKMGLAQYGLSQPAGQVQVGIKDQRLPLDIYFGQPSDSEEVVYAKTSNEPRIVRLVPDVFRRLRAIFYQVQNLKLVRFLNTTRTIELASAVWKIQLQQSASGWHAEMMEGSSSSAPNQKKEIPNADSLVQMLGELTYLDVVTPQHPHYSLHAESQRVMEITFTDQQDDLIDLFAFSAHPELPGIFFLKRHSDGMMYLVAGYLLDELFRHFPIPLAGEKSGR